jgi:putative FmdB family regulatory protein
MPTYEYACKSCGTHLEVVQSFTDEALTVCPSCQGQLRKVFGNIGISFNGSGFYKNDSRAASTNGKGKKAASPSAPSSGDSTSGDSTSGGSTSGGSTSGGSTSGGSSSSPAKDGGSAPAAAAS